MIASYRTTGTSMTTSPTVLDISTGNCRVAKGSTESSVVVSPSLVERGPERGRQDACSDFGDLFG